jgi:aerotaxis receptor
VVASDVRALAQRTSAAAREIRQPITESAECVAVVGSARTGDARACLGESLPAVSSVDAALDDVGTEAREQRTGTAQIDEAVTQMDTTAQQNAAMVEELATVGTGAAGSGRLGQQLDAPVPSRVGRGRGGRCRDAALRK